MAWGKKRSRGKTPLAGDVSKLKVKPVAIDRLDKINAQREKLKEAGKYVEVKPYKTRPDFTKVKPIGKKTKQKRKRIVAARQVSVGEKMVAEWLVKNGIKFKSEKEFMDLINPMTGKRLIIDFYLHRHKTCIEFDGRQHFMASEKFDRNGDSLEARIQRDQIKNDYCATKGLKLIRIKYTEMNNIHNILKVHFKVD